MKALSRFYSSLVIAVFTLNIPTTGLDVDLILQPLSFEPRINETEATKGDFYDPFSQFSETTNYVYDKDLVGKLLQKPIPRPTASPTPTPKKIVKPAINAVTSTNQFGIPVTIYDPLFEKYGQQYNVHKDVLKLIAKCESTFNANAVNGPYYGLFQFHAPTWRSNRKAMGLDPNPQLRTNPEESIRTAAYKIGRDGIGAWPVCGPKAVKAVQLASS